MRITKRYSLDSDNRLNLIQNGISQTGCGGMKIDQNNRLLYWLNPVSNWKQTVLPKRVVFDGNWELDQNHNLLLHLNSANNERADGTLLLSGEIISVEADTLIFSVNIRDDQGLSHIQIIKLTGTWSSDDDNCITFEVTKNKAKPDILTFEANWQLNKNQHIVYNYTRTDLSKRKKKIHSLLFRGYWDIGLKNRLTYLLGGSSNSRFDFDAAIQTKTLYPQACAIKYRIGMGVRKLASKKNKTIILHGDWKLGRGLGLSFEMEYEKGIMQNTQFQTSVSYGKNTVAVGLKNAKGNPIGITLRFDHAIFYKYLADFFLQYKNSGHIKSIEAGLQIPF